MEWLRQLLPQGIGVGHKRCLHSGPLWERACPRRGRQIQHRHQLTHRLREQARSHRFLGGDSAVSDTNPLVGATVLAIPFVTSIRCRLAAWRSA